MRAHFTHYVCAHNQNDTVCIPVKPLCTITQLQNPTARGFHVCQPISATAWVYVYVFTHTTIHIPEQSPTLHALTPLGEQNDSTQVRNAGHILLPSPGKAPILPRRQQRKNCIGQNLLPLPISLPPQSWFSNTELAPKATV